MFMGKSIKGIQWLKPSQISFKINLTIHLFKKKTLSCIFYINKSNQQHRYKYMRDNLRNHWKNSIYGCEFISGVKSKLLSDSAINLSSPSNFSKSSSFKTECTSNSL